MCPPPTPPSQCGGAATCSVTVAVYADVQCGPYPAQRFDSMSDRQNCGGCNKACAAADACIQGACVPATTTKLANGFVALDDIVVDASNVYVADTSTGTVSQIDKVTGATVSLATNQTSLMRLAADGTYVYWTHGGGVSRAPIGGATPAELLYGSAVAATGIVLDGADVYWSAGTIFRAPKIPNGAPATSISAQPSTSDVLRVDGTRVYGTNLGCNVTVMPRLFGIDKVTGAVTSYVDCISDQRTGTNGSYAYYGLGVDGANVVAMADKSNSVTNNRVFAWDATTKDRTERDVSKGLEGPGMSDAFVVDTCGFYWPGTSIHRLLPGDAFERRIVQGVQARRLAVDATHVYWTDATGYVGRAPK